jgi:hypothetical protein
MANQLRPRRLIIVWLRANLHSLFGSAPVELDAYLGAVEETGMFA